MHQDADYIKYEQRREGDSEKRSYSSDNIIDSFDPQRKSGEVSHFHRLKSDEVWYYTRNFIGTYSKK